MVLRTHASQIWALSILVKIYQEYSKGTGIRSLSFWLMVGGVLLMLAGKGSAFGSAMGSNASF